MTKTGRSVAAAALFLLFSLGLTACSAASYQCTDPLGCLEIPPGSPLVIGTLLASAGEQAADGEAALAAVQQALDETGELLGHPLEIDEWDTDCSVEDARRAATSLALSPDVAAVIGPTCARQYEEATSILGDAGLALLDPAPGPSAAAERTRGLLAAIEQVAVSDADGTLHIPRQSLLEALQINP